MQRTWIKICGLKRTQDAELAAELGADALGMVFVPASPRAISISEAKAITSNRCGLAWRIGLFLDAAREVIEDVLSQVDLDMLQFHGGETPEFCSSFGLPYIKALPWSDFRSNPSELMAEYRASRAIVLDSHNQGELGGTGKTFDWEQFPGDSVRPLILAGGLVPGNVAAAIQAVSPYGVDVSSGIESHPGVKDAGMMKQFFDEVQRVDSGRTNE